MTKEFKDIERIDGTTIEGNLLERQLGFESFTDGGSNEQYKLKYKTRSGRIISFVPEDGEASFSKVNITHVEDNNDAATKKYVDDVVEESNITTVRPKLTGFVSPEGIELSFNTPARSLILKSATQNPEIKYYINGALYKINIQVEGKLLNSIVGFFYGFLNANGKIEFSQQWNKDLLPLITGYRVSNNLEQSLEFDFNNEYLSLVATYHGTAMDSATREYQDCNVGAWLETGCSVLLNADKRSFSRSAGVLVNGDVISTINESSLVNPTIAYMTNTTEHAEEFTVESLNSNWLTDTSSSTFGTLYQGSERRERATVGQGVWYLYFVKPDMRKSFWEDVIVPLESFNTYEDRYKGLDAKIRKCAERYIDFISDWKILGMFFVQDEQLSDFIDLGSFQTKDLLFCGRLEKYLSTNLAPTKIQNGDAKVECKLDGDVKIHPSSGYIKLKDGVAITPETTDGSQRINFFTGSSPADGGHIIVGDTIFSSSDPKKTGVSRTELGSLGGALLHSEGSTVTGQIRVNKFGFDLMAGTASIRANINDGVRNTNNVDQYEADQTNTTTVNKGILEAKLNGFTETQGLSDVLSKGNDAGGQDIIGVGKIGVGTKTPVGKFQVKVTEIGNDWAGTYPYASIVATDAHLDIVSTEKNSWGSGVQFKQVDSTSQAYNDAWAIIRQTSVNGDGDGSLYVTNGTNRDSFFNSKIAKFNTDGTLELPVSSITDIDGSDPKTVPTKEWVEQSDVNTAKALKIPTVGGLNSTIHKLVIANGTSAGNSEALEIVGVGTGSADIIVKGVAELTVYNHTGVNGSLKAGCSVYRDPSAYNCGMVNSTSPAAIDNVLNTPFIGTVLEDSPVISNGAFGTVKVLVDLQKVLKGENIKFVSNTSDLLHVLADESVLDIQITVDRLDIYGTASPDVKPTFEINGKKRLYGNIRFCGNYNTQQNSIYIGSQKQNSILYHTGNVETFVDANQGACILCQYHPYNEYTSTPLLKFDNLHVINGTYSISGLEDYLEFNSATYVKESNLNNTMLITGWKDGKLKDNSHYVLNFDDNSLTLQRALDKGKHLFQIDNYVEFKDSTFYFGGHDYEFLSNGVGENLRLENIIINNDRSAYYYPGTILFKTPVSLTGYFTESEEGSNWRAQPISFYNVLKCNNATLKQPASGSIGAIFIKHLSGNKLTIDNLDVYYETKDSNTVVEIVNNGRIEQKKWDTSDVISHSDNYLDEYGSSCDTYLVNKGILDSKLSSITESQGLSDVLSHGNDAGGQQVKNLAPGTESGDAINKSQLDGTVGDYLKRDGTLPMTGDLEMDRKELLDVYNLISSDASFGGFPYLDEKRGYVGVGCKWVDGSNYVATQDTYPPSLFQITGTTLNFYKSSSIHAIGTTIGDFKSVISVDENDNLNMGGNLLTNATAIFGDILFSGWSGATTVIRNSKTQTSGFAFMGSDTKYYAGIRALSPMFPQMFQILELADNGTYTTGGSIIDFNRDGTIKLGFTTTPEVLADEKNVMTQEAVRKITLGRADDGFSTLVATNSNADLQTVTGVYYYHIWTNTPSGVSPAGFLTSYNIQNIYIRQQYRPHNSIEVWERIYTGSWSGWKLVGQATSSSSTTDANSQTKEGTWWHVSWTNTPSQASSSTHGYLTTINIDDVYYRQTYRPYNSTEVWERFYESGWSSWVIIGGRNKADGFSSNTTIPIDSSFVDLYGGNLYTMPSTVRDGNGTSTTLVIKNESTNSITLQAASGDYFRYNAGNYSTYTIYPQHLISFVSGGPNLWHATSTVDTNPV